MAFPLAHDKTNSSVPNQYRAGTLIYTRASLVGLFFWLLWGDFCFTLMEVVMPSLLPLALKDLGASNLSMGFIVGSIPYVMNMFVNPVISVKSDRHRGPRGRRIPFLLLATPFVTLFLILIGYGSDMGGWLHLHIPFLDKPYISSLTLVIILLGAFVIGFEFFNMFISSIFYYLVVDVVPQQFMGRFMSWFRVVGTISGFFFHRYIFSLSQQHMKEIYVVISLIYLVTFVLMCWRVKEGEYPPSDVGKRDSLLSSIKTYIRECFSHSIYRCLFIGTAVFMVGMGSTKAFGVFFPKETLGLSLEEIGKIHSWTTIVAVVSLIPAGYLSDKLHPLRINIIGTTTFSLATLVSFFCVYDKTTYFIFSIGIIILYTLYIASNMPMFVALVPREKYGQFGSANAVINAIFIIAGTFLAGKLFDLLDNYRYILLWRACFGMLSLVPMFFVYRAWQKHGGINGYIPPQVDSTNFEKPPEPVHNCS